MNPEDGKTKPETESQIPASGDRAREAYHPPCLRALGSVSALTGGIADSAHKRPKPQG